MPQRIPHILSIAGSDSGGGAGIQADLKTFSAFGCYGMTAITAVTSQNSLGVHWIEQLSAQSVDTQIHAVVADFGVHAVKVGMLGSEAMVQCVAQAIKKYELEQVVIDPVLVATSGATLGDKGTATTIAKHLFPLAKLITPNLYEASVFLGKEVKTPNQMKEAATELLKMGPPAVLLKGGHLEGGDELLDLLAYQEQGQIILKEFHHLKIHTKNSHGTGCTLSSAIACGLGSGLSLSDAVNVGIDFVQQALVHGSQLNIGQGAGSLWHAYEQYSQIAEK
jgi:hydroxymethylpyrimidine/phosphomethylpyrimidine kinase